MDRQGRRGAGPSRRLSRREADPAALRLIERHGAAVLRAARRWSLTPEDAEDAYQRGLEILLTKAPAIPDRELLPWLKTVVIRTFGRLAPLLLHAGEELARAPDRERSTFDGDSPEQDRDARFGGRVEDRLSCFLDTLA